MTIYHADGGEFGSQVQLNTYWDSFPSPWITSAGTGRRGGRAIEARSLGPFVGPVVTFASSPVTDFCVGFAMKQVNSNYGIRGAFYQGFTDYLTDQVAYFWYKQDVNEFRIYDDTGSLVQTYSLDLTEYSYIEFVVDSAAGRFKLYINEDLIFDQVGFSTSAADSFALYGNHGLGATNALLAYVDDLYVASERKGDIAVLYFPATADVSVDFTPSLGTDNYALVDEVPEDDANYNQSALVGDKDIYDPSVSFGLLLGDVLEVTTLGYVNVPDGGVGSGIIPKLKIGTTEYSGTQVDGVTVSKRNVLGTFSVNPATGAAFTQAEAEAIAGFGWEIGS